MDTIKVQTFIVVSDQFFHFIKESNIKSLRMVYRYGHKLHLASETFGLLSIKHTLSSNNPRQHPFNPIELPCNHYILC